MLCADSRYPARGGSLANPINPYSRSRCNHIASAAPAHLRAPRLPVWGRLSPSLVTLVMCFIAPRLSTAKGRDQPPRAVPDPRMRAGKALQVEDIPTEQRPRPAAGRVHRSGKFSQASGGSGGATGAPLLPRLLDTRAGELAHTNSPSYPQSSSHTSSRRKSPSRAWLDHHSCVPHAFVSLRLQEWKLHAPQARVSQTSSSESCSRASACLMRVQPSGFTSSSQET